MAQCIQAACECDSGGNILRIQSCSGFCDVISEYAQACTNEIREECPMWRSERLCPMMCEALDAKRYDCVWHYECCSNCYPSCEDPFPVCDEPCIEGCAPHCPEGKVYSSETKGCEDQQQCIHFTSCVARRCRSCRTMNILALERCVEVSISAGWSLVSSSVRRSSSNA